MKKVIFGMIALVMATFSYQAMAGETVKIAWSHYTGWEPLGFMQSSGILAKHAAKHGVDVEIVYYGDYVNSIFMYASNEVNGVAVTNMDALAIAGVGGRISNVLIVGDYSNGNDGLVIKGWDSLADVPSGTTINLVEFSVSHYMLARCLEQAGLSMDNFVLENANDADIPAIVESSDNAVVVSWNPMLMSIRNLTGTQIVCDSSQIPGEIIDMVVVGDEVSEDARQAIVGAWYEVMALIESRDPETLAALADQAGSSVSDFESQLDTTQMFYTQAEADRFISDPALKTVMESVVHFSFDAGIYDGVDSVDELGVRFPDGSVLGDETNVMLDFSVSY